MGNHFTRQVSKDNVPRGLSFCNGLGQTFRSSSWVHRLLAVSVAVLIAGAVSAAPDSSKRDSADEDVVSIEAPKKAVDTGDKVDTSITTAPSLLRVQNSYSTREQEMAKEREAGAQLNLVDVSDEQAPPPAKSTDVKVYKSREFGEYHWQSDCLLVGKGQPQPLLLEMARREGLIECGVCRRHDKKKGAFEKSPKAPFFGNRRPMDDRWRRHVRRNREEAWRESVDNSWRLDSQADSIWRGGQN
jgi:hypothetical protein